MEEPYLIAAYADIGRAIVAWGLFEQDIISLTWRHRDPSHSKAFPQGPIEPGFYKRWLEWCRRYGATDRLRNSVIALSDLRDDLSHNIVDVSPNQTSYCLGGERRCFDWHSKWDRWARKYADLRGRWRPLTPKAKEPIEYYPSDLAAFHKGVLDANTEVREVSEAWLVGHGYPPLYMPPIQPWTYRQELDPRWER